MYPRPERGVLPLNDLPSRQAETLIIATSASPVQPPGVRSRRRLAFRQLRRRAVTARCRGFATDTSGPPNSAASTLRQSAGSAPASASSAAVHLDGVDDAEVAHRQDVGRWRRNMRNISAISSDPLTSGQLRDDLVVRHGRESCRSSRPSSTCAADPQVADLLTAAANRPPAARRSPAPTPPASACRSASTRRGVRRSWPPPLSKAAGW